MNESSSILVSEIADLRQHLAAAVKEVSDTHYACDEKLLAAQAVCSDWVDRYRRAMAERDKMQCDLAHAQFDRDAALNLVEAAESRAQSEIEMRKSADNQARLAAAEAVWLRSEIEDKGEGEGVGGGD